MRTLTAAAQEDRDSFESNYSDGCCSCHINPPCGYCTDPGNPLNQDEHDECWEETDEHESLHEATDPE